MAVSALLAQFSLGITRTGVKVFVPKHDLAYLMYYLKCVTRDMGIDDLDDDLLNYRKYNRLSNERRACVLEYARQYNPKELIDKVIFRDDDKIITRNFKNEFCDISVACGVVSVQPDVVIAGKMQSVTKVMFYQQSWLDEHYYRPIKHASAQSRHTNPYFKAIMLYLAPLLYLTALFLSVFVFLSPAVMLHDQVALLTVAATAAQAGPTDGLRFFLGALGLPQFFDCLTLFLTYVFVVRVMLKAKSNSTGTMHKTRSSSGLWQVPVPSFFSLNAPHRANRSIHFSSFYAPALHSSCCSGHTLLHHLLLWLCFRLFRLVYADSLPFQVGKDGPNVRRSGHATVNCLFRYSRNPYWYRHIQFSLFDFSNLHVNKGLGPSLGYTSRIRNLSWLSMRPFRTLNIKARNSSLASEMDF